MQAVSSWVVCTVACTGFLVYRLLDPVSYLDCVGGIGIGVLLWWVKITYGNAFESFIFHGSIWAPITVLVVTIFLIRIHPEPADACCKCFEDGVAFAGVFIGVKFGQWRNRVLNSSVGGLQMSPNDSISVLFLKLILQIVLGSDSFNFKDH